MPGKLQKPIIFAHRGASAHSPENTLASFSLAVSQGADAVELDAKLSSDEKVVVIHDATVDRTTEGRGKVNELSLEELKVLDAGNKFHPNFSGEKIPTLDEVFESVGKKVLINVELTNYSSSRDNLILEVSNVVKRHHLEDGVLFSSFDPRNLRKIQLLLPHTPVGILCLVGIVGMVNRSFIFRKLSPENIHPYLKDVTSDLVIREHQNGRKVNVWTVNEESDLQRMIDLGVDGIFTDDPLKALRLLEQK